MAHATLQLPLPTEAPTGVGPARAGDFAAVRVGGAIDGHEVIGSLAEGGMGAVFKVRDRAGEGQLALKAPLPGGRGGSYHHRMRRFLREARLTARMDHSGVARVREQGQAGGLPYFTLELVDGVSLSDRLYDEGVLPVAEAVRIAEQVARALHHVHGQGVVHRDLKPSNILLRRGDGAPVIIDFGLARDATGVDPRITQSGVWLGTPAYIAPEQAQGEASRVDGRADVYSLGAVLYELLTGVPPHGFGSPRNVFRSLREDDVQPPSALRPGIPAALDRLCLRALARDRADRFPNAECFANALADLLADLPREAPAPAARRPGSGSGARCAGSTAVMPTAPAAQAEPRRPVVRRRERRSSRKHERLARSGQSAFVAAVGRYAAIGGPAAAVIAGLLLLI